MSTTIDQRVVEMQFNNSQFESNVKTSLNSIEKLKQSLNFSGVASSFEDITSSSEKVDLSSLSNAAESVRVKFSALEVVAVTALSNITNSAIEAGKQLISSLSVDNISSGWEKFANKTQSVGTLISQGYDLETVTEQLERLNWYTDETSYNFTDMVANIAKFTASGQDLETSVTAMEGIANWAALSGQNATTASNAMYQLAQAMSAGYMRLEDYKSIQNASMDTEEFRQKCIDAAVALGTLKDNADGTYTSVVEGATSSTFTLSQFTTSLTKGAWLTSDVMMDVFNEYSGAVDQIYEYAEEKGITASEAIEELGDNVDAFGLKAFKAAQEARSWADVIDSVKDAVSTGWMNTFEHIFGNYEEATELWTDLANALYDVFAGGAADRNEMLETWKELGGRAVLIDTFWTAWENVGEILGTVKEAFREVFPRTTAEQLYSMTEGLQDLIEKFKMGETSLANLKNTFKGIFSVLDIVKQAVLALGSGIATLLGGVGSLASGVLGLTGSFGDWLVNLDKAIKESDIFNKGVQTAVEWIQNAVSAVIEFAKAVKEWLGLPDLSTITASVSDFIETVKENFAAPGLETLKNAISAIGEAISSAISAILDLKDTTTSSFDEMGEKVSNSTFVKVLSSIWSAVVAIATAVKDLLSDAISGLVAALGNADLNDFLSTLNELLTGGLLVGIVELVYNFATGLGNVTGFVRELKNGAIDVLDGVGDVLQAWSTSIRADAILEIAAAVGILAVALIALTAIDSEKLNTAIGAITGLCVDLVAAMAALEKLTGASSTTPLEAVTGFIDSFANAKQYSNLIKMAAAIGILAVALALLASVNQDNLGAALGAITGLFADLTVSMAALSKLGSKASGTTVLLGIAASILVLSSAMKSLSGLSWEEIQNGLIAVTDLCVDLMASMAVLGKFGSSASGAVEMIALAAAIKILASACETFAEMSWEEIDKGLSSVGVLLSELALFTAITGNTSKMASIGAAMIAIGAAMKIFASAVSDFADMTWEDIAKGLLAIGAALTEVAVAVNFLPKDMVSLSAGMVVMGAALEIVADAVGKMGSLSLAEIAKGLITMGVALAEMVVALNLMEGSLSGAASLVVVAAAIDLLTPALKALGDMSILSIATALIALAGAFTVIGVAGTVLAPMTTTILSLAGAFALIGVSVAAVGAGLVAAGAGITTLAASLSVGLAAIVSGIKAIILAVITLIPDILVAVGEGIIGICDVIAGGASSVANAVKAIILALVDVLVECVPELASGALELLLGVLDTLGTYAPQIVTSLVQFIIGIIEAIADNIPELLTAVMDLIGALFSAIVEAINGLDSEALLNGIVCVGLLSALVVALSAISGLVPSAMAALVELGILVAEMAVIFAAIGTFAQIPGLTWLIDEGAALLEGIGNAIGAFAGGIVGGFMGGVSSQFPQIGADLAGFMENAQPFIEGASNIDESVANGVLALCEIILALTAADILNGLTSWFTGGSSIAAFGKELAEFAPYFSDYYLAIQDIDGDVVTGSANAALALAEMADKLPNSGGVVGWFTGENSLSVFAEELAEFGPALKSYADSVQGLDSNVVLNSANAAEVLFEMADKLPEQGGITEWFTGSKTLSAFGEELVKFGPLLKTYSDSVKGVDESIIYSSANAAKALFEMEENLPEQSNIVDWFTGSYTLSAFGKELTKFGPLLKTYSDSVKGVDESVVYSSANAAKALFEMEENLPDKGGITEWFTGSSTLSEFGAELVKFGPYLAEYAKSISEVDSDNVTSSANAALVLAEMADYLPSKGGILSWFTGSNSISAFGKELALFGPYLTEYAKSISGIDSDVVTSSANAALVLAEMAAKLPNSGGIISWFEGDNNLADFGEVLAEFGPSFADFYQSVSGIEPSVLSGIVTEFGKLVDILIQIGNIYTESISGFAQNLTEIGTLSVKGFIGAFDDAGPAVRAAATNMMSNFIGGVSEREGLVTEAFSNLMQTILTMLKTKYSDFQAAGSTLMKKLVAGIKSEQSSFKTAFANIISACLTAIKDKYSEFQSVGSALVRKLTDGITSQGSNCEAVFANIVNACLTAIKSEYSNFQDLGKYFVEGFVNGITENTWRAEKASKELASASADAAAKELDEHSPSKVGYRIGDYFGVAFVNAIGDYVDKAYSAGSDVANSAKTGLTNVVSKISDVINGDFDFEPTIRPVLDLSDVQSGVSTLDALFSRTQAQSISANLNREDGSKIQNSEGSVTSGNTYQFTQNNYSPKSLSRSEIYRQTKNQFSALERLVET